jgi:hypothetical protein
LFFTRRFSILYFFVFCFLVDTDATAGVGPRGLLNNISDSGVSELDGSYRRSLDAARYGAYCTARAAVGNENEANAAQQEQCRQRARCRRRQQRQICNIANSIFERAAIRSLRQSCRRQRKNPAKALPRAKVFVVLFAGGCLF